MSDTTGTIVIVVGIAISLVGLYLLSRTRRQGLGLIVIIVGFTFAGTGLLTLEGTVEERPPATSAASTPAATPAP
jgi:hypothetical protein